MPGMTALIGGVVITAVPTKSVTALAVLAGIWFIVQGLFEIAGGFMYRRTVTRSQATAAGPPPQPGAGATAL